MTLNDPIRSLEEPTPYVIEQNYRFQHPLHDSNNRPLFSRRNNDCETENGGWSSGRYFPYYNTVYQINPPSPSQRNPNPDYYL